MDFERGDLVVHGEDPKRELLRVIAVSTRQRFGSGEYLTEAVLSIVRYGVRRDGFPAHQYRLATEEEEAAARAEGTLPAEVA